MWATGHSCCRFFTSGQSTTLRKVPLSDTAAESCSRLLGVIGISILPVSGHERASWWAQWLAEDSQFTGRRARWTWAAANERRVSQLPLSAISWPASAPPPLRRLSVWAQVHFSSSGIIALWCLSHQRSTSAFHWGIVLNLRTLLEKINK